MTENNNPFRLLRIKDLQQSDTPQQFIVTKFSRTSRGIAGVMLKDDCGRVYYSGYRDDVRDESQEVRRAFCRLMGVRNADMTKAVKALRESRAAEYRNEEVQDLQRAAAKLGFALVEKGK